MKIYHMNTPFGRVDTINLEVANLINILPITIHKNNYAKKYFSLSEYMQSSRYNDGPVMKRFMSRVISIYAEEAITMMINERAEIPITANGTFMAIGEDQFAPVRKNYKFDPMTAGKKYSALIYFPEKVSRIIGFVYRIKLHRTREKELREKISEGFKYPLVRTQYMLRHVVKVYEKIYLKRFKNPKYGYAIKF